jgi:two-component system sensor histidine kinase HydH
MVAELWRTPLLSRYIPRVGRQTVPLLAGRERMRASVVLLMVGAIAAAHYSINPHLHLYHDLLRRSMYVPIIAAAIWFGTFGGVGVALIGALLYAPHLFFQLGLTAAEEIDRSIEMFLYVFVGGLTGLLAERERWQRRQTEQTLERLRHTHDQLQRQTDRLAEVQEGLRQTERLSTLGELAADLAHEIRNPLAAVRGTVQLLAAELAPGHKKHDLQAIALEELDRLNGVVEGYLRTARSRGTKGGCSDAIAALSVVVDLVRAQAQRAGVTIEQRGPDHLWVGMDTNQLRQVFLNLALNAVQAMPAGGLLRIECSVRQGATNSGFGDITFSDSGPGVPPESRDKIFQPFFTTKPEGTGLGLSIAHRLVHEHGGTLSLEVPERAGSVFRVRLPLGTP